MGHVHIEYTPDRQAATVKVVALHSNVTSVTFKYLFDGVAQDSDTKKFDSSYNNILNVQVQTSDGAKLVLPQVDFVWNAPNVLQRPGGNFIQKI